MKRYRVYGSYGHPGLSECPSGDWVKWEDVEKLKDTCEELRKENEDLRKRLKARDRKISRLELALDEEDMYLDPWF